MCEHAEFFLRSRAGSLTRRETFQAIGERNPGQNAEREDGDEIMGKMTNGGSDQTTNEDGDIVPTLSYPS